MADLADGIVLETERLVMRRERPGDLAVWLEHINTPQVMKYSGVVQPLENVEASFARMAAAADEGLLSFYFLALKSDGLLIGKAGLSRIEEEPAPDEIKGEAQVGWTLRADQWGKGYAREAAQAALALAFDRLDLPRVFAQTSERNAASWGLMERLGMSRRRELEYPDTNYPPEDNPMIVYSIERDTWRAAQ